MCNSGWSQKGISLGLSGWLKELGSPEISWFLRESEIGEGERKGRACGYRCCCGETGLIHDAMVVLSQTAGFTSKTVSLTEKNTTHSIVSVYITNLPVVVWNTHSIVFFIEVHKLPALFSFFFVQFWVERETIQLFIFHWKKGGKKEKNSKPLQISHPEITFQNQNSVLSFM